MTDERPIAVVTGASAGIGAATVDALVGAGWNVIAAARRIDRLQELAARHGDHCLPIALDVTDAASAASLPQRLPEGWRAVAALVNNAGHDIGGKTPFEERPVADWIAIIETNISGMMRVTHALAPALLAARGHVVNIGSIAGVTALANDSAYCASKFAVNGFSKALRLDYSGRMRVTEILPGVVETEFDRVRRHGDDEAARRFYAAFARRLQPEDIAACVLFALSQPAHVTIAELLVMPSA
ncbi:MAG: SDR family NAD(P)-dependent oxidoreductase [Alphaproteobacteria bacterium]|nr:SDR family NAD(P)-dependent oxidoreductase [Alphaproteobacteria bacterium]